MLPSDNDSLRIVDLPSDVIRKIIGVGQESINGMKLIGHRWNALCLEYLHLTINRKRLPAIKKFYWTKGTTTTSLIMHFSYLYRNYFGVEKWHRQAVESNYSSDWNIEARSILRLNADFNLKRIPRLFARCSRIEKLELRMDIRKHYKEIDVLISAMKGLIVEELVITVYDRFPSAYKAKILDLICSHKFQRLSLLAPTSSFTYSRQYICSPFLLEAIRLVSSVDIHAVEEIRYKDHCKKFWRSARDDMNKSGLATAMVYMGEYGKEHVRFRFSMVSLARAA